MFFIDTFVSLVSFVVNALRMQPGLQVYPRAS